MLKTILSFLEPTLLLAVGQIATVVFGLAVHWVVKQQGYAFGGLASLDLLPKNLSRLWDGSGEKELRKIQALALALIVAGVTAFFTTEAGTFWHDLWPEMVSTGGAVLGIDELNRRRSAQEYKREIIRQIASFSNNFALEAVRIAANKGWLNDGSLQRVHLQSANLANAHLRGADLTRANLFGANLQDARLMNAHLNGALIQYAKLQRAELILADLRKAFLMGSNLEGANLASARLEGVVYDNATHWPDGFDPNQAGAINWDELNEEEREEWRKKHVPEV